MLRIESVSFPSPWSAALFRGALEGKEGAGFFLGAWEEEALEGYIGWQRVLDEVHILNLAVDPARRRRGTGRLLLRRVLEEEAGRGAVLASLEVRAGNSAAQDLYRAEGFKELAIRKKYYTDTGEDAIIMGILGLRPGRKGEQ